MILSYNIIQKEIDSSNDSIKEERINEIENIMNINKKSILNLNNKILDNKKEKKTENNTIINDWNKEKINLSNSFEISKIDLKSQSIGSLKESFSKAEDYIQKDISFDIDNEYVKYIYLILIRKKTKIKIKKKEMIFLIYPMKILF